MKTFALVLAAALPVSVVVPASAQQIEAGKWTGTVTAPDEQAPLAVTYDVVLKGDTIDITVTAAEHGQFRFSDVKLTGDVLTFWFQPGPRVDCTLTRREDGAFAGSCRDEEGGDAAMLMVPPKKG